ncbi:MAG: DNA integrity scanning diadenylate cyclase DisA [Actinobacteria bacterium]|nr:DNA integrity scanning diadenylate cyclase DisA [Actinomycetota bacterium]
MKEKDEELLLGSLRRIAPGTDIRTGIEYILQGKTGALIVVGDSEQVLKLVDGGFYIGCSFTPAKFYELAKMDGAIILSRDAGRILYANAHLYPNPLIKTTETGTRHRTAERVAKQTKTLVISISQKRDVVTIYIDSIKYILEEPRIVLSKANQALQTLAKYKEGLDYLMVNLNVRELEDITTLYDVVSVLQKSAIVQKTEKEVKRFIYELGSDGRLLNMQVEELMINVVDESLKVIEDYKVINDNVKPSDIKNRINAFHEDTLFDLENTAKILGYKPEGNLKEFGVQPRGIRIISEIKRLPDQLLKNIFAKFKNLKEIINASIEELSEIQGMGKARASLLHDRLKKFAEYYLYNEQYSYRGGVAQKNNF